MNAKQYREQRDQALREKWRCQNALKDIQEHLRLYAFVNHDAVQQILTDLSIDLRKMASRRG